VQNRTTWKPAFAVVLAVLVWLAVIGIGMLISTVARADPQLCGPHDTLLAALLSRYHERPIAFDIRQPVSPGASPGSEGPQLLEVLMSADGSTGTLIATDASGRSCILSALTGIGKPA